MAYSISFDPSKCCACSACMIGCIDQNDTDFEVNDCFRCTYKNEVEMEDGTYNAYLSAACMHCVDAPCISGCPVGCISKDPVTGFTVYDNTNCIGCKSCAMACPFGVPRFRKTDGKMVKCDGCNERVKNGLKPSCVNACPFEALTLVSDEDLVKENNAKAMDALLKLGF